MQLNNLSAGPLAYAAAGAAPLAVQAEEELASAPGMAQESYRSQARIAPDGELDAPDFDSLSSDAEAFAPASSASSEDAELMPPEPAKTEAKSRNIASELTNASFLSDCTLQGDCAVQAFMEFGGTQADALVHQVRDGLQKGDQPFEVTVITPPGGDPIKVKVDPAVYQSLTAAAPDGPGLNPSQALTMVVRLAVAQAMDPGASIAWVDDGEGGGVLALDGSTADAGKGLSALAATTFMLQAGLPIVDTMAAALDVEATSQQGNGAHVLAFLVDPKTGIQHPVMLTREGENYRTPAPERKLLSRRDVDMAIRHYMTGNVAPNGGLGTTGTPPPGTKKFPK